MHRFEDSLCSYPSRLEAVRAAQGQHTPYWNISINSVLNGLSNYISRVAVAFTQFAVTYRQKVMLHPVEWIVCSTCAALLLIILIIRYNGSERTNLTTEIKTWVRKSVLFTFVAKPKISLWANQLSTGLHNPWMVNQNPMKTGIIKLIVLFYITLKIFRNWW